MLAKILRNLLDFKKYIPIALENANWHSQVQWVSVNEYGGACDRFSFVAHDHKKTYRSDRTHAKRSILFKNAIKMQEKAGNRILFLNWQAYASHLPGFSVNYLHKIFTIC